MATHGEKVQERKVSGEFPTVATIILAGGLSTRLGRDKAALRLRGLSLLDIAARKVRELGEETLIIAPQADLPLPPGARLLPDETLRVGPLGGVYTGLLHSAQEINLVLSCDLPFVQPALLRLLRERGKEYDVTIPRTAKGFHPLCAAYSRRCLGPIKAALDKGDYRMISFHSAVRVLFLEEPELRRVDPDLYSLLNINTWEDYCAAMRLARQKPELLRAEVIKEKRDV